MVEKKKKEDKSKVTKYWITGIVVILSIILIFSGIFLVFPITSTSDISCSTGKIDTDIQVNWYNEKVTEEIPKVLSCKTDPKTGLSYDCEKESPEYTTRWKTDTLPQSFRLMGIDNMNCRIKTTSTNNILYELFSQQKQDKWIEMLEKYK